MSKKKLLGLIAGLATFAVMLLLPAPEGMTPKAWHMVAVVALIAIWWITEATRLFVTALLPIVLLPIFGITPASEVTEAYGNQAIYLFLGGFMIAIAMERSGLHKRFALHIVRIIGFTPQRIILGFMLAVFVLSMWVSNTATVLMVIPICMAIVSHLPQEADDPERNRPFTKVLLLSIAYAASIGGAATLIGTPPNIIFASIISEHAHLHVSFLEWMAFALPVTFVLLLLTWFMLVYLLYPVGRMKLAFNRKLIDTSIKELGPMNSYEWRILGLFGTVAGLWMARGLIEIDLFTQVISDTTIAIFGAIALFLIPTGQAPDQKLLDWEAARNLPWNTLLLFGGGLALSKGVTTSGLNDYLVAMFESLETLDWWLVLLIVAAAVVFLTELISNTAAAALLIPVMISAATAMEVDPLLLVIPTTIATSFAFMLPVATPPNAIVYGTNQLRIGDMVRSGFWLNILSIIVLVLAALIFL